MKKILAVILAQTLALAGFAALSDIEKATLEINDATALGDFAGAKAKADEAVAKFPNEINFYVIRAGITQMGGKESAEKDFEKIMSLGGSDFKTLLAKLAVCQWRGDKGGVKKICDEILAKTPSGAFDYYARASVLYSRRDMKSAHESINKAIELDKDSYIYLLTRMGMFLAEGDTAAALADAKRSLELCPDSPFALATYGSIEFHCKNYADSAKVFEELTKKYPKVQNFTRMASVSKSMAQQEE